MRKSNSSSASIVARLPPIPPALHKILARASLNLNEPVVFKLSSTEGRKQKPSVNPNAHVAAAIARALTSQVSADAVMEPNGREELDSRANMVVLGIHAYILNS